MYIYMEKAGSGRIKQRLVETTRRASLKREYHYLTILLPVIHLQCSLLFRANSYLLLFDAPYAAPGPSFPPPSATLFIEPQNLDVYFSDFSDFFDTTREGLDGCFVPTALFPPSCSRQSRAQAK